MWRCDLAACLPVSWLLSLISADWSISAHQFHQSEMETALSLLQVYPMHSCTGPERLTHTGYHSSLKHMQELRSQCFTATHRARIAQTRPFSSALACLPLLCSVLQTRAAFPQFRLMPTRLSWRSLHGWLQQPHLRSSERPSLTIPIQDSSTSHTFFTTILLHFPLNRGILRLHKLC